MPGLPISNKLHNIVICWVDSHVGRPKIHAYTQGRWLLIDRLLMLSLRVYAREWERGQAVCNNPRGMGHGCSDEGNVSNLIRGMDHQLIRTRKEQTQGDSDVSSWACEVARDHYLDSDSDLVGGVLVCSGWPWSLRLQGCRCRWFIESLTTLV